MVVEWRGEGVALLVECLTSQVLVCKELQHLFSFFVLPVLLVVSLYHHLGVLIAVGVLQNFVSVRQKTPLSLRELRELRALRG